MADFQCFLFSVCTTQTGQLATKLALFVTNHFFVFSPSIFNLLPVIIFKVKIHQKAEKSICFMPHYVLTTLSCSSCYMMFG